MLGIGKILKSLRKQKGISLRILGKELGISFTTLSAYERNKAQPTIENCYKLSKFFEVPIEYFILGENAKKDLRDIELLELINKADKLDKDDREVIKNYIKKYLKTKNELKSLKNESE